MNFNLNSSNGLDETVFFPVPSAGSSANLSWPFDATAGGSSVTIPITTTVPVGNGIIVNPQPSLGPRMCEPDLPFREINRLLENGMISRNEVRRLLGLEPQPDVADVSDARETSERRLQEWVDAFSRDHRREKPPKKEPMFEAKPKRIIYFE